MTRKCARCGKKSGDRSYCPPCVKKAQSTIKKKMKARIAYRLSQGKDLKTIKDIEREAMEERLAYFNGNRSKAAISLGMSVRGFRYKVKEYELHILWPPDSGIHRESD